MIMNLDVISQLGIVVFGLSAMFLVARKNKWGFVVGLISQPFYIYSSYSKGQWGIFFVSFFYTANKFYKFIMLLLCDPR